MTVQAEARDVPEHILEIRAKLTSAVDHAKWVAKSSPSSCEFGSNLDPVTATTIDDTQVLRHN